jgi:hypothetical protein
MPGLNASLRRFSKERRRGGIEDNCEVIYTQRVSGKAYETEKNTKSRHFFDIFGFLENGPYKCYLI